ncbi:MAG: S41 family peptidase [Candidatus Dojkabacteria bacterium]
MEQTNSPKTATRVLLIFIGLVIFFVVGFYLGRVDLNNAVAGGPEVDGYTISGELKETRDNVNVNLLWEVWSLLEREYIEKTIVGQELLYGSVRGLVSGLNDPYTAFLTPTETNDYFSANKGEFEGIGTTLRQDGEFVAVESPIDGAPAQKAGLEPGDLILEVDGEDMQGISVFEVAATIRGEAGTDVTLSIFRPKNSEQFDVTINRAKIDIDNISLEHLEDDLYKVKIFKFTEESVQAFNNQWDDVVSQIEKKNAKALVIDLRNNPGGFVNSVEYVLGDFLKKGTLIFSEEDRNSKKVEHRVDRNGRLTDMPIVVIVNQGSASASEIFAGALQDHKRAEVIGTETVGKGVEQRLITLSDGSTLQLVFQKWLTPSGKNISEDDPIMPDEEVKEYQEQEDKALEKIKSLL